MNTPSHSLTTYWLMRHRRHAALGAFASFLPDLPYFIALGLGLLRTGFTGAAFIETWSNPIANFIAQKLCHNLLFVTIAGAATLIARRPAPRAFVLGWALHVWVDFSLHVNDAYPVLWPLTSRVFPAPVSYWDRDHHGALVGGILGSMTAALWIWLALRLARAGARRRLVRWAFAGACWVVAALLIAGLAGELLRRVPAGSREQRSGGTAASDEAPRQEGTEARHWIEDGIRWPPSLAPSVRLLESGDPLGALSEIERADGTQSSVRSSPGDGAEPWQRHGFAARRALLSGYALDLAGRRAEALEAYRDAEKLEPVGDLGDKARRYQGEVFRDIADPPVSAPWCGLFLWGLALCGILFRSVPRETSPRAEEAGPASPPA